MIAGLCSLLATLAGMFRTACIPVYETSNSQHLLACLEQPVFPSMIQKTVYTRMDV